MKSVQWTRTWWNLTSPLILSVLGSQTHSSDITLARLPPVRWRQAMLQVCITDTVRSWPCWRLFASLCYWYQQMVWVPWLATKFLQVRNHLSRNTGSPLISRPTPSYRLLSFVLCLEWINGIYTVSQKTCDYIFYNNFNNKCPITIIFCTVSSKSMSHRKMVSFPTSPI